MKPPALRTPRLTSCRMRSFCPGCPASHRSASPSASGLNVAPPGHSPRGEMHSAKTFPRAVKLLSPPLVACLRWYSVALAAKELTERWTNHRRGTTRMNTQNVKTAAPESTERWGKKYEILLAEGVKGGKPEEY